MTNPDHEATTRKLQALSRAAPADLARMRGLGFEFGRPPVNSDGLTFEEVVITPIDPRHQPEIDALYARATRDDDTSMVYAAAVRDLLGPGPWCVFDWSRLAGPDANGGEEVSF